MNLSSDAPWLQKGERNRAARPPPVCVVSACARPTPTPRQQGGGRAVHLPGQSLILGPTTDVSAQESQCLLVLDCLLLHCLDLHRPALLCGPGDGWDGHGVGQGPGRFQGMGAGKLAARGIASTSMLLTPSQLSLPVSLLSSAHLDGGQCTAVLGSGGEAEARDGKVL